MIVQEAEKKSAAGAGYGVVRVLHVIWALDLGGAEQVVLHLVRNFPKERFEPVVCCLNMKGRFAPLVEERGIRVITMHKAPKFDPFLVPRLVKLIRDEKIGLVHTHLFTAHLWGRLAAHFAGVPVVCTEHGMDVWRRGWHFALERFLIGWTNRMIYVSGKVREFYLERVPGARGRAVVLHNGIDLERFQGTFDRKTLRAGLGFDPDQQVLGIVGRLSREKAHQNFLKLIRELLARGCNVAGLIVGDGPRRAELEKMAAELGISERIVFTGLRKDVPELYAVMDLFILCSDREGFPMTVLEAMAAGVPVVATDVGGIRECLVPGEEGLLVPHGNVEALANAGEKLLADESLCRSMTRRAANKVASRFSVAHMIAEHEKLYEQVLLEHQIRNSKHEIRNKHEVPKSK